MPSKRCIHCGLVNFAAASICKRCGADLSRTDGVSSEFSLEVTHPNRGGSKLVYLVAVVVGFFFEVVFLVLSLFAYASESSKWFILASAAVYACLGSWFNSQRQLRDWLLALSLSSFYLIGSSLRLLHLLQHNETYGGWFWTNKFYFSPVLLFLAIPFAAFFGARFGSKRSLLRFAALTSVFVVASVAVPYTEVTSRPTKEANYSTDIVAGESGEFVMRLELGFRLQITDDPTRFRAFQSPPPTDSRAGWNVTVLRKDSTFTPTTHMTLNIDGNEIESTMWPINRADGSSHIDFSQKQDYSDIVNWRVGPGHDLMVSLVNAHHITLTWGNMNVVLPDEQVKSLRMFVRNWGRMLHDEDMLCTNPMCQQGALNPQR